MLVPSPAERAGPRLELPPLWSALPKGRVLHSHHSPSSSSPRAPDHAHRSGEANVAHPTTLVLEGKPHHAGGSCIKLISSTHASSPTRYLRSPKLVLDYCWSTEPWPGSAPAPLTPVSPRDRHRLELARTRENASSCL